MTVGVVVRCENGIVIASDSLATFSRGAPVARQANKVYTIEHEQLEHPIALIGAGMTAFMDKFVDRARRDGIDAAAARLGKKLDIIDFVEHVGESIVSILFKEYVFDRNKFFGAPIGDYSLSVLAAGATVDKELRSYHIHSTGLSERIEGYGTTGSGAAYAELFLHGFMPQPDRISVDDAVRLVAYAIKGVEIMDPNVGGDTRASILKFDGNGSLTIDPVEPQLLPPNAKDKMEEVLKRVGDDMRQFAEKVPSEEL